jgi:hypothetical protein
MPRERILLAGIGLTQGVAFWALVESWPEAHPARALCVALFTFLAIGTAISHFAWTGRHAGRLAALAVGVAAVYAAVAFWVGWQLPRAGEAFQGDDARATSWVLATFITLYALGPFLQIYQASGRLRFPYERLFLHSWNNFFVGLVGSFFVGALWIVLLLWAQLFKLVGIEFFKEIFSEPLFVYCVTGAAAGFGVALGRESERVIGTLRSITLGVCRALLPLTAFVALIFVATLPFTGLEPLWETDRASPILLWWIAITILFLNAVYQDGSGDRPYAPGIRWMVEASLVAMIVYAGMALYGTGLRIGQYGLTPNRYYGVLFTVILGLYALGYAVAVARRAGGWLAGVRRVNLGMALVIVAIGLLIHTPLLDPLAWSARNQFARLAEGRVAAAEFDYAYLRFELGRAGNARLDALDALAVHPESASIRERIQIAREVSNYWEWTQRHGPGLNPEDLTVYPLGSEWPEGLFEAMRAATGTIAQDWCHRGDHCSVFPVELDGRPGEEYVVFLAYSGNHQLWGFRRDDDGTWQRLGRFTFARSGATAPDSDKIRDGIRASQIETRQPLYSDLVIDGQPYRLGHK